MRYVDQQVVDRHHSNLEIQIPKDAFGLPYDYDLCL